MGYVKTKPTLVYVDIPILDREKQYVFYRLETINMIYTNTQVKQVFTRTQHDKNLIVNHDFTKDKCYIDVLILDRVCRYYGVYTGKDLYDRVRESLSTTKLCGLPLSIKNGDLIIPNNCKSLVGCTLKRDYLMIDLTRNVNELAISHNVIVEQAIFASKATLQADSTSEDSDERQNRAVSTMLKHIMKEMRKVNLPNAAFWIDKINTLTIAHRGFSKCTTVRDYQDEFEKLYAMLTGKTMYMGVYNKLLDILKPTVQSSSTEVLGALRGAFNTVNSISENEMIKKLQSVFSYALVQGYLSHVGLTLSDEDYSKMEQRQMLNAYSSKKGFFFSIIDTALYIAERLDAWYVTGDFQHFLHSERIYSDWLQEADRLLNLAMFTSNLTALDNSNFKFKADLMDAIEKGKAYVKYTNRLSGVDCVAIRRKLCSLELLYNVEVTRRAAQIERKAPFGVLIAGHSSIAKSAFTKVLYNAYGSVYGLDRSDAGCYSRNSFDEFWSGFNSSQWCIRMDDIAFLNPAKSPQVDQSIIEMLNIINNVPYVPNQASLDAKGTTPVLAKLVLATTNTLHLNTQTYFACPLAANRRLPYVIDLKPKPQYIHENGVFIDPSKLQTVNGEFPDFWIINVKEIIPRIDHGLEMATFSEGITFTNINVFLKHFLGKAAEHERNQTQAVEKNADMAKIEMCKVCLFTTQRCTCDVHVEEFVVQANTSIFKNFFINILIWLLSMDWFVKHIFLNIVRYKLTRSMGFRIANIMPDNLNVSLYTRYMDARRDRRIATLTAGLAIVSALFAGYYAFQTFKPKDEVSKDIFEEELDVQAVERIVETQFVKETNQNVWYVANPTIATFDIPIASRSLATATDSELRDIFDKNCVAVAVKAGIVTTTLRGIFVIGQKLLLPAHAFKQGYTDYSVSVIRSDVSSTHNTNYTFSLKCSQLVIMKDKDLCMIEVTGLPPHKDITKFIMSNEVCPSRGFELMRHISGELELIPFFNLHKEFQVPVAELGISADIFMGVSARETADGMCGSMCVGTTPRGPIIMGMHLLGYGSNVGFVAFDQNDIQTLLKHPSFKQMNVQGGGSPILSCSKRAYNIQPLHHRSLLRYLPKVNANVYGTLSGFVPNQKSKVCATPLQQHILDKYGREVAHGAPYLGGYHAVKQNVEHMVVPLNNYNKAYLKECVVAFSNDIINGLPESSKKELITLSDKAAINGLPGVKFIDSINRGTSMGFPYNTTKRAFLLPDVDEEYPDGVTFTTEVMEDMRRIENLYKEGKRAYPIMSGHNKDEALSLAKVLARKARLFTGAPAGWSIIVRKYLLPFVRVVQKNQFLFEAGPGLVCQSNAWDLVRDYLTQFGLDQIVGGDYEKFDKKMLADFILAAFDVIIKIMEHVGASPQELLVIQCIAYDIAFPVCNINGDLIEFFGTNPSGHPLTVIINSIVNSLYVRYCYRSLNPEQVVSNFKEFVALFTYGDDNAMGISKSIPWFNHTTIQKSLAEIGVGYTMADKLSKSVPYIHIDQASFLKRTWRWDERMQVHLCPLEEESIFKSLTVWVPSESIDEYAQFVEVVSSAVQEYFFYGEEKFEEMRNYFMHLITSSSPFDLYVTKSTFPTYEILEKRFKENSMSSMQVQGLDTYDTRVPRYCYFYETKCSPDYSAHLEWLLQCMLFTLFSFYISFFIYNILYNKYWQIKNLSHFLVYLIFDLYYFTRLLPIVVMAIFYRSMALYFTMLCMWIYLCRKRFL